MQSDPSYGVLLLFKGVSFPENYYSKGLPEAHKTMCKESVWLYLVRTGQTNVQTEWVIYPLNLLHQLYDVYCGFKGEITLKSNRRF